MGYCYYYLFALNVSYVFQSNINRVFSIVNTTAVVSPITHSEPTNIPLSVLEGSSLRLSPLANPRLPHSPSSMLIIGIRRPDTR